MHTEVFLAGNMVDLVVHTEANPISVAQCDVATRLEPLVVDL